MRMCSPHRSGFFELVALGLGLLTASVHASAATGSESFSSEEQSTTGLTRISPAERAELDRQIEREITLAREGDVVAFAKSFTARRTAAQLDAAGLTRLSAEERGQLDFLIARAIARRPATAVLRFQKKESEDIETVRYRAQLHGEVSLTYGTAGRERYFYGGSLTAILDDPNHHLTVAFTYAEYHSKGLRPFVDCEPFGYLP